MSVKKAKGETEVAAKKSTKRSAKKSAKKSAVKAKAPVDIVTLRESINHLVGKSARVIANKVIEAARDGQLASARYLFEAVGLYPATEETTAPPVKDTLAHTLLTRLGLPLDPVVFDEDLVPPVSQGDANAKSTDPAAASDAQEDGAGECEEETKPMPVESEDEDGSGV